MTDGAEIWTRAIWQKHQEVQRGGDGDGCRDWGGCHMTYRGADRCGRGSRAQILTQALRLKQTGVVHPYFTAPRQEVGCVVPGKEGARGGASTTGDPAAGECLWETNTETADDTPTDGTGHGAQH